ncbi:reverse transcriptase domain-containing protein [Tanacetum coccineum]
MADVLIHISSVLEVSARFQNTLYGYFIRKKVAFLPVEGYVLNAWKKFGVECIMGDKRSFVFIKKWTPTAELSQDELSFVHVWVKLQGVPALDFTADGSSAISTRLGTLMMLDSCTVTACTQSWGRMDYARALIDLRADRALKNTLNKVATSHDGFQTGYRKVFRGHMTNEQEVKVDRYQPMKQQIIPIKMKTARGASTSTSTPIANMCEVLGDLKDDGHLDALNTEDPKCNSKGTHMEENWEDNENSMDDLVDDTRKKVGTPPRKTGIWFGKKADSSSESGFTSPNHFDLLTKEDGNSILCIL